MPRPGAILIAVFLALVIIWLCWKTIHR